MAEMSGWHHTTFLTSSLALAAQQPRRDETIEFCLIAIF